MSPSTLWSRSTPCYDSPVGRTITQRELRNDSGEIRRCLDLGESFIVTRNGTPVGELTPLRRHRFVSTDTVVAMFRHAPAVDARRFREDLDAGVDQDTTRCRSTPRHPARTAASVQRSWPRAAGRVVREPLIC
jgi:antitoxin (DNA-binding transcriptional repressor) of toxin-antitoxin stability system